ncbi:predicted coding region AF_1680 [Archaeoglobus fulgidus DSM 4304]|uniref:Uncharacterized protein AF_1680 n=3 Tax=Archaeoglobus fulgidus TaxID=2234 RepID=Y1680_ARCFU|nr:RecName: Full=Uncharacterized protein AF_1680 [Archaeoglobus fulgidus DSM 4304]AAB89572.1 predicted coding region AF_1680 [Archaeoglobus fulgidus DSM 4304]AIG98680.1 hypothetical protein AFULGI_00019290 [Archaeoglobus fulgidus DSM 8774]
MKKFMINCFVHLKEICYLSDMDILENMVKNLLKYESEVHKLLSTYESAGKSRIIRLDESYKELDGLSIEQDELFREALRCVENGLFRAAHVLAWAGFIDFLHSILALHIPQIKNKKEKWKISKKEDFREYPDFQIIEAAKDVGILNKSEMKTLKGLLSKRNECAHPSDYFPDLNETLGYISELLKRIKILQMRIKEK